MKVNGQQVDTITVTPKQEFIHKTPLTVQQLGPGDMVELTLEVDKTWVPALLPNSAAATTPASWEFACSTPSWSRSPSGASR